MLFEVHITAVRMVEVEATTTEEAIYEVEAYLIWERRWFKKHHWRIRDMEPTQIEGPQ